MERASYRLLLDPALKKRAEEAAHNRRQTLLDFITQSMQAALGDAQPAPVLGWIRIDVLGAQFCESCGDGLGDHGYIGATATGNIGPRCADCLP